MVFTQKIIWESLNCGIFFLKKVYVRVNKNWHENSIKIAYKRISAFKTRGTRYLKERRVFKDLQQVKFDLSVLSWKC